MISLYKRGRVWWVRGSYAGARIRPRSLDASDKVVAEKRRRQIELNIETGEIPRSNWKDFVAEYLAQLRPQTASSTKKKYERTIKRFVRLLDKKGIGHVGSVTAQTISEYLADRAKDVHPTRKTPMGQAALRVDLLILHGLFAYGVRCKLLPENPVSLRGFEKGKHGETMPFPQAEVDKMLAAARAPFVRANPESYRALLLFFLHTGLRISDVSSMTKRAVNLKDRRIIWRTQKRGKTVFLPIHPRLAEAIEKHLEKLSPVQRASVYLFPTRTGKKDFPQTIDAKLRRIFDGARIVGGHAHRFRDTFAVRLLEHGATLYDVAKLLGITIKVAEEHYSPYVQELQERGRRLVGDLDFVSAA